MSQSSRKQQALRVRQNAAELAAERPHPRHENNGDELRYRREGNERSYIGNFTKGLPHCEKSGLLLNPPDYQQFVLGIQSGLDEDFEETPLGPAESPTQPGCLSAPKIGCHTQKCTGDSSPRAKIWSSRIAQGKEGADKCPGADVRGWESQAGGLAFDLEGPDAQAVTMPPAPELTSDEAVAEMAEVYLQALLRDVHVSHLRKGPGQLNVPGTCKPSVSVNGAGKILAKFDWFKKTCCDLNGAERGRHRGKDSLDEQHIFRGIAPGDDKGPYLSQFMLIGTPLTHEGKTVRSIDEGYISYGSIRIDQRVRVADPCVDYMTTFQSWLDVQNGANVGGLETYRDKGKAFRFITTPRDLATYVHYDALYEAYLNAVLILFGLGAPLDPGLPFGAPDVADRQQGFATFGGPHILSLVTEVATRALKAVRYQKFNLHRRLRPEAFGGLVDLHKNNRGGAKKELAPLDEAVKALQSAGVLDLVRNHNAAQNANGPNKGDASAKKDNYFLPMAFPEGSPMHPSYGAGHATVAGACTTILKAFFDHGWELPLGDANKKPIAYEPSKDGSKLLETPVDAPLTVEGEANKLAANISIGRDWAGVHYFTDYIESLRMGELIALGILEEQKLTYGENFTMTVPLFDGGAVRI